MKQSISKKANHVVLLIAALFMNVIAFAQEKSLDVNVDIDKGGEANWYANPWIWIVGAAVFILLLVAITRGGSRTSD
jgi:hypothetical protein